MTIFRFHFVFVSNKIPKLEEMVCQIQHNISFDNLCNIMPRQSTLISGYTQLLIIFDIPLIINSGVVMFQSWKLLGWRKQIMFLVIESAVADVKSSNIGLLLINYD